ncbi:nuclease (SNase domain-containing protein) [Pyrolobus fumarii 1A]|uniref:Nuclease (SNase domain-containing protein) n=1 Tax=Pyrolobus fumarii (strain DSM 11204 / 1A) TaxID=694429 RepID=G0EFW3_PYRF1|nr:nuclease (SNase domain-containing protein) [Pyrolobus fumarii 1A]
MTLVSILAVLALVVATPLFATAQRVDVIARLEYVVDGDTVRIVVVKACSERFSELVGFEGRLRLADVNAPEIDTPEGIKAKRALQALLAGHETLYIDVDDVYVFDKYGRIVGVLLIDHNETTLLNVNAWLLERGLAEPRDYPNEFRPTWPLYAPKTEALAECREEKETRTVTHTVTVTITVTRTTIRNIVETVTVERPGQTTTITETVTRFTTVTFTPRTIITAITTTVTLTMTIGEGAAGAGEPEPLPWLLLTLTAALIGYLLGKSRQH